MGNKILTWILRFAVAAALVFSVLVVVALVDAVVDRLSQHWRGKPWANFVEVCFMCILLVDRILNWVSARVWVGAEVRH